jgi:succinate-semialdehyde dehydrogenase/glutarate-semialdehyde dehydrogenase
VLRQEATGVFDVGPLFWDRQLAKVEEQMEDALDRGATVLVGGKRNAQLEGLFFEPTVLTDVDDDMRIMKEETFGPVLPIVRVQSLDEAVDRANDTRYGLSGTVWTADVEHGVAIAERLETGSVCINDMALTYGVPEAPFGGRKDSGVGQANGEVGVRSFCHPQPVIIDRFGGRQAASQYPYNAKMERMTKWLIRRIWGRQARP